MRAVGVDEDAGGIDAIMGVSAKVGSAVGDDAFPACGAEALGDDETGKARADDEEVGGGHGG